MAQGNNGPSYKDRQRNVSVYLGRKGGPEDELLDLVCKATGKKPSQFFRECYLEKLIAWGVIDIDTLQPIPEAVDKLRQKVSGKLLPNVLDR